MLRPRSSAARKLQRLLNGLVRIPRAVVRATHRVLLERGAGSWPFISGDALRRACHLAIDRVEDIERLKRAPSQGAIFIASEVIPFLTEQVLKNRSESVYVVHNGDLLVDESVRRLFPPDAVVFAQNCLAQAEKCLPVPIGLENEFHYFNHGVTMDYRLLRLHRNRKVPRILYGFTVSNNAEARRPALNALESNRLADHTYGWSSPIYRRILNRYQFVASPPGNGLDCHRTWEAMYLRTVPIVERNDLTEYFRRIGLPLLVVDDWRELNHYQQADLEMIYQQLSPGFSNQALSLSYWRKAIRAARFRGEIDQRHSSLGYSLQPDKDDT